MDLQWAITYRSLFPNADLMVAWEAEDKRRRAEREEKRAEREREEKRAEREEKRAEREREYEEKRREALQHIIDSPEVSTDEKGKARAALIALTSGLVCWDAKCVLGDWSLLWCCLSSAFIVSVFGGTFLWFQCVWMCTWIWFVFRKLIRCCDCVRSAVPMRAQPCLSFFDFDLILTTACFAHAVRQTAG